MLKIELRQVTEAVAAARRSLPPGGVVPENYVFEGEGPEGAPTKITFSDLFEPGKDTLFIYNMMFPRAPDKDLPCPSCTQFLDSFDGVAEHAGQRINVAVVVKTTLSRALAHAENRGWRRLRILSSAGNTSDAGRARERLVPQSQLPVTARGNVRSPSKHQSWSPPGCPIATWSARPRSSPAGHPSSIARW